MRSQIEESIEELQRKIDVATHSKQSVIKGYTATLFCRAYLTLHVNLKSQCCFLIFIKFNQKLPREFQVERYQKCNVKMAHARI
jgi:hypothetical protein